MTNWEYLVSGDELKEAAKERKNKTIKNKVDRDSVENYLQDGWFITKEYKNGKVLIEKNKPIGDLFENEVWNIFYRMGFTTLNSTNDFKVQFSKRQSKQVDIVAIDDEVCLLIECKCSDTYDKNHIFDKDLKEIPTIRDGIIQEISSKYPGRKFKYIFATKNYSIGNADRIRMEEFDISNFEMDVVDYYDKLVNYIGPAAKYQLLGNIFAGKTIENMESMVPAIEGIMGGGLKYYSFSIEPERLLKLAYILHRDNANETLMPTYQRLITKDRLTKVKQFVDNGGYFPNSIIISIDNKGADLLFEPLTDENINKFSRAGILHLPKTYSSAFVIDGQHRLYGYSDSTHGKDNAIPVVAFVDMDKYEQLKMFMDINENQKAVNKTLRNSLNINIFWNSESYLERSKAVMLALCERLGTTQNSPLYDRIVTGTNSSTNRRCITSESLRLALEKTSFFNKYKSKINNEVVKYGTFDKLDNKKTLDLLLPFLIKSLRTIEENCLEEWDKGNQGYIAINNCMSAIIRIIDDIVNIKLTEKGLEVVNDRSFYKECEELLTCLGVTLNNLSDEAIHEIKTAKGAAAENISRRKLQVEFHNRYPEYTTQDLEEYIEYYLEDFSEEALYEAKELETKIIEILKQKFMGEPNWLNKYVPESTKNSVIANTAIAKNNNSILGVEGKNVTEWDFISYKEVSDIISYGSNWSTMFQEEFKIIEDGKPNKKKTVEWLKHVGDLKRKAEAKAKITKLDYEFINEYYTALCKTSL
ncbi:DNA sulfur modification protein DndB [Pseudobutyrivibrio sp. YE44]|uniref:DGQHR domain-containing protein n=1 Tax=Pseudobutyrivibrio sp. YE44 TaxID=1520802 RepID=UPI000885CB3B|nr:DGQHR domain-containing protein [Pseudobutyrivibrio sp. YE44]SDB45103.1 DNA sulfur modification protein DndB [Pseudobutyrivibrio sp. YE44]